MTFANRYQFFAPSRFNRLIPLAGGEVCVLGACGTFGIVQQLDAVRGVKWGRRYMVGERPLAFFDGVAAPDGFALLATLGTAPAFESVVVVRIDATGAVLWARQLFAAPPGVPSVGRPGPGCRIARRALGPEEFVVMAWPDTNPAGFHRDVGVLVRVDASGAVLDATRLANADGGRFFDIAAVPGGYRLVGDHDDFRTLEEYRSSDHEAALDAIGRFGLVVDLDPSLKLLNAWSLSVSEMISVRGLLGSADGKADDLIAVMRAQGETTRATALVRFAVQGSQPQSVIARRFGLGQGLDRPARLVRVGDASHAILDRPDLWAAHASIARVDAATDPILHRGFTLDATAQLFDLATVGPEGVRICGTIGSQSGGSDAVLLGLDGSLDCCRTHVLPTSQALTGEFEAEPTHLTQSSVTVPDEPVSVGSGITFPMITSLCGSAVGEDGEKGERLVQSPYLNLQAAGSPGTGAAKGVLLRWFLDKTLGAAHLPKGDLASTNSGFNRPGDFVTIHRASWPAAPPVRRVSFSDAPAAYNPALRVLCFMTGPETPGSLVYLRFLDAAAFNVALQSANPELNPTGFLAAYGAHPVEIELRGRLALACDLAFEPGAGAALRVETLSVGENRPLAPKRVSSRRILHAGDGPVARLVAENLRSVRVEATAAQLEGASFICYDDVLTQVNAAQGWTRVGDFALSLDQTEAFRRLEDPARFQVHGHWRNFNDGALVNVANYHDRWAAPEGLGVAVQKYVHFSDTDPQAIELFSGSNPKEATPTPDNFGKMSISYLGLLQMAAINFHVARMLGLGCVDADAQDAADTYIHLAEYLTVADLGDGKPARPVQHLYMSLPTRLDQERLPDPPELGPVEYGLSLPTGSGAPYELTDAQGYTPDGQARYIRLYPGCAPLYAQEAGFFDPPLLFDIAAAGLPTCYGIDYRGAGEAAWRKPEIAHDSAYLDTGSPAIAEPRPSPFPAARRDRPFIHKETQSGFHEYAAYAIDLFSRGTALSQVQATDATAFVRPNRLLPPINLQVQLIQPESPRVLTTKAEQDKLVALGPGDPTLVRVSFDYGFVQDSAYGFADQIEIFFRETLPDSVAGAVTALVPAGPSRLRVELGPYTYASPPETVTPALTQQSAANFVGGVLVAGGRRLIVEQVDWTVPAFVVVLPSTTGVEPDLNTLVIQDADPGLALGDLVVAIENMAAASSWGPVNPLLGSPDPLATRVTIAGTDWQSHTESFTRPDGTIVSRQLRGLWKTATVTPLSTTAPRRYKIGFDGGFQPHPHAQSGAPDPVEWWRGEVRLSVAGRSLDDRRSLRVKQVDTSGGALELIADDESGEPDLVLTGNGLLVNYYPGYRLYLHADPARSFDWPHVKPAPGQGSRMTLLGARSVDGATLDANGHPYRSAIGVPQLLTAIEIVEPKRPRKPDGLAYATPPDSEHKSSYTLTVEFDHEPFSAAFFRADAFGLLHALYSDVRADPAVPSTFEQVVATIFPIERDPWVVNRYTDLFAYLEPGSAAAAPASYDLADGTAYALPTPDAEAFADRQAMREAMLAAFTALTEQPLIYGLISDHADFVPSKRKQVVRNANGDLLFPNEAGFDLSPMAKRPGGNKIQFTDFTLDGSMHPDTLYFYFVRELGNRMAISEASPIFGPVKLVNLTPPPAPVVRNLASAPFDVASGTGPRVTFEVIAPSPLESIARLRIHRTTDPADALSVRTMPMVAELVLPATGGVLIVTDAFDADPPYGDPLFYRLVWVREVAYDDLTLGPQTALAVSEPSPRLLTNLVDVVNPEPPVPTLSFVAVGSDTHLRFAWTKTVHNGVYRLSHLNTAGVWARVATLASNAPLLSVDLAQLPPKTDEDGNPIYHRFKIDVENSSGLLNRRAAPITVDLTTL